MRNRRVPWLALRYHLLHLIPVLLVYGSALAQWPPPPTNTFMPTVSVVATDPLAKWSGDTGTFTFWRSGPLLPSLNVYYQILGTASNGVDYEKIGNYVQIPSGAVSGNVVIKPIDLGQTNIETVTVVLAPSPLMPPVNYMIGYPSEATVFITPGIATNIPPWVEIATPRDGTVFPAPANVPVCALALDPDGYVSTVEFFEGTNSLGVTTNNPFSAGPRNPFCLVWSNVPPGNYVLTAKATDDAGASTISPPVNIKVATPPPPTNFPPVVRIMSPPNGAIFRAPMNIPIYAYAKDFDDSVATVEFFAGTNSLGLGQGLCGIMTGWTNPPVVCPTNLFVLVWSNPPVGSYTLTAKATDDHGATTMSRGVNLSVLPSPPPPSNRPPVVSIVAIDPIAIEGTNCWPWLGLTNSVPTWSNWNRGTVFCRFFTNCGPKNATFAVRRAGATNDDLTVLYAIGGTATNGVDYLPLTGSVTIPAGERRALVTVVPLDDGPPDINSTVVLKLDQGTNYLVGFPNKAAALIIDSGWPRPVTGMLSDDSFNLSAPGPDGAWFHVECSTDLVNWTSVCTNQVVNGSIDFVDPDAAQAQARFYRAVPEPDSPGE